MEKIAYVIATYSGKNHTSNKELSPFVLQQHIEHLLLLFENKKKAGIQLLITNIVVVIPPVEKNEQYPGYYDLDTWSKKIAEYDVIFTPLNYNGENKHHSYDQWIQACTYTKNIDYFILIEDDYCLDATNLSADLDLLYEYKIKFPNNIGYLASFAGNIFNCGYHAAISNGMISKKTWDQFDDPLSLYYTYNSGSQLSFSELFIRKQIQILDYTDNYNCYFWNSFLNRLEGYSSRKNKHLFVPIHYIKKDLKIYDVELQQNHSNKLFYSKKYCECPYENFKKYIIISNTCRSSYIHKKYLTKKYSQALMSMHFINDEEYVLFCRHYHYFSMIIPEIKITGKENGKYYDENKAAKYIHPSVNPDYPILTLDNIDIHCIHHDEKDIFEIYHRRQQRNYNNFFIPVFTWVLTDMINKYTTEEASVIVKKFCDIPNSIFIGNYQLKQEWGMINYSNFITTSIYDSINLTSPRETWGAIKQMNENSIEISKILAAYIILQYGFKHLN